MQDFRVVLVFQLYTKNMKNVMNKFPEKDKRINFGPTLGYAA